MLGSGVVTSVLQSSTARQSRDCFPQPQLQQGHGATRHPRAVQFHGGQARHRAAMMGRPCAEALLYRVTHTYEAVSPAKGAIPAW